MAKKLILLVDNDLDFAETIQHLLEDNDFDVISTASPSEARELAERNSIALALIDIRLVNNNDEKDLSGLNLAMTLRDSFPKIIITAFPTFEAAREVLKPHLDHLPTAIDFVSKRDGPQSLLTAVHSAIRLSQQSRSLAMVNNHYPTPHSIDAPLYLDEGNRCLRLHDEIVELTRQEYAIMSYLFKHANEVRTREEIIREALGEPYEHPIQEENRLNNIISRLRRKIEHDPTLPEYIQTARGHGFKLVI